MTSERRLLVGFDDLRAITLECKKCGTRLTFEPDMAKPGDYNVCPGCGETWLSLGVGGRIVGFPVAQFLALLPELVKNAQPDADTQAGVRILLVIGESDR